MASSNRSRVLILGVVILALCTLTAAVPQAYNACQERKTEYTILDGSGNPRQVYLHKQLTSPLSCASGSGCAVSKEFSVTNSYSFSGSVNSWISGGFSVERSKQEGEVYQCNGVTGDEICVWHKAAYTRYDVISGFTISCPTRRGDPEKGTITSPNKDESDNAFYCVVGTCRSDGDQYWEE